MKKVVALLLVRGIHDWSLYLRNAKVKDIISNHWYQLYSENKRYILDRVKSLLSKVILSQFLINSREFFKSFDISRNRLNKKFIRHMNFAPPAYIQGCLCSRKVFRWGLAGIIKNELWWAKPHQSFQRSKTFFFFQSIKVEGVSELLV